MVSPHYPILLLSTCGWLFLVPGLIHCAGESSMEDPDDPYISNTTRAPRIRKYGNGFRMTREEEMVVDEFRPKVEHLLYRSYMRGDNYLVKFLRARNLDVNRAADMLKSAQEWRKANKIDTILKENFTRWEKQYPFIIDGMDEESRPLYFLPVSKYDVRKAVISGHREQLARLYDYSFEKGSRIGYHIYESSGRNAGLQGILIIDLVGFNLRTHACLSCAPVYVHIVQAYESYYPQHLHKIYMINAHPSIDLILQLVRPFMSAHSRQALEVYGSNKDEWVPVLLKHIPKDQLPVRYGGTKGYTKHLQQL